MTPLFSTAYWPSLHYFYYVLNSDGLVIEQHEHYQKQSYRNRAHILSANGPLALSIPVKKQGLKEFSKDIAISYSEDWPIRHWRAIVSAYKNSPYFDFFEDEIYSFYNQRFDLLLDYNTEQLKLVLKILKLKRTIVLTESFEKTPAGILDLRGLIHPKINFSEDALVTGVLTKPYYQTFGSKFGFVPNLSILDLLFNVGLESRDYLKAGV